MGTRCCPFHLDPPCRSGPGARGPIGSRRQPDEAKSQELFCGDQGSPKVLSCPVLSVGEPLPGNDPLTMRGRIE